MGAVDIQLAWNEDKTSLISPTFLEPLSESDFSSLFAQAVQKIGYNLKRTSDESYKDYQDILCFSQAHNCHQIDFHTKEHAMGNGVFFFPDPKKQQELAQKAFG